MSDRSAVVAAEGAGARAESLFAQAERLRRRGEHAAAERAAHDALGIDPYNADGHCLLARIHAARGDAGRARDEWLMALRLAPGHAAATAALASRSQVERGPAVPAAPAPGAAAATGTSAAALPDAPPSALAWSTPRAPAPAAVRGTAAVESGMPSFEDPHVIAAVLVDRSGLVVAQRAADGVAEPTGETLGALLSSLATDTGLSLRALCLGAWKTLSVECASGGLELASVPNDHLVIVAVKAGMPRGLARRYLTTASRQARALLEQA
jgi:predicted regulator of Ras-like GTPase activity (Roadblock/LC7/MglB family)